MSGEGKQLNIFHFITILCYKTQQKRRNAIEKNKKKDFYWLQQQTREKKTDLKLHFFVIAHTQRRNILLHLSSERHNLINCCPKTTRSQEGERHEKRFMRFGLCVHHKTTICFFSDRASISFQWVIKFIFCFTILHFKWILELIDLNSTFWLYPRIWWSDQLSHKLNFIFCRWNQNKKMNTWDHKARSLFPSRLHFNTEKMSSHLTIFILLIRKQSRVFWSQQTLGLTWKEQTIKRLTPKIEMDALSSLDLEFLPLVMSPCVDDNSIHHTSHAISSVTNCSFSSSSSAVRCSSSDNTRIDLE